MIIETSITIQKPLFDVFKMATDYENLGQWQPSTRLVKVTAGDPVRTGSMVYIEKQFLGGLIFVNGDIIDFQRHKSVEMTGIHGRFRFRRMTEFASGGRETTIRDKIDVKTGFLYVLYTPILQSALKSQIQNEWKTLKKKLES